MLRSLCYVGVRFIVTPSDAAALASPLGRQAVEVSAARRPSAAAPA